MYFVPIIINFQNCNEMLFCDRGGGCMRESFLVVSVGEGFSKDFEVQVGVN